MELRPINNPPMASERKRSASLLSLNQKLEMMKLSKEGVLKAETGRKLGLMSQTLSQVVNAEEVPEGNEKCYFSEHMNDKKAQQPYCGDGESLRGLERRPTGHHIPLTQKPDPEQGPNSLPFCEG